VSEWFHAEGNRQQGPLPAEQLVELFRNNQISLDTLVSGATACRNGSRCAAWSMSWA